MGCNCGGKSRIATSLGQPKRVTVYQAVSPTNSVVEEFTVLADARAKATEIGGRVKVTSKTV
jgi:hypothetical protein